MPFEDLSGTVVQKICMACSREFQGTLSHCPHDGNQLQVLPQDAWEGKRLAERYQIKRRLGTGGMGVVYLAWHELMERWVAIKMLKQSFVEDRSSVLRFQQEAKAASRLKHPNVITLHDFGVTNTGQPYMVMDYLSGYDERHPAKSLSEMIKDAGQLPVEKCIHILAQACDALDQAHRQGVIHRDIKPANIMIVPTEDDPLFVKVVDFGVAKLLPINKFGDQEVQGLTQLGEVCGSPVYMSPEQCMGQALDSRADIYSMGVVIFETLTGKLPFLGRNMVETMRKHMDEKPPSFHDVRPDLYIPDRIEQVVMRALAKQPHARQQSMAELAQDLRFSIPRVGQTPTLKAHELLPLPEEKEAKVAWLWPAIGGGAVVALAIAGLTWFNVTKPAQTQRATPNVVSPANRAPISSTAATPQPAPKTAATAAGGMPAGTSDPPQQSRTTSPPDKTASVEVNRTPPRNTRSVSRPVAVRSVPRVEYVATPVRQVRNKALEDKRFADLLQDKSTNREF